MPKSIRTTNLPPYLFPPIYWFVEGIRRGSFQVDTGGLYQKQSLQSRYLISGANKVLPLTVPVLHTGAEKKYANTQISYAEKWQNQHVRSLQSSYKNSPFFEFYDYKIIPIITNRDANLISKTKAGIAFLTEAFQLDFPTIFSDTNWSEIDAFPTPEYPQVFEDRHGYIGGLSALDLLFNLGPESCDFLKKAAYGI